MTTATLPEGRTEGDADRQVADVPVAREPLGTRLAAYARAHRLFTSALAVAAVLRLLVAIAYPPVLEFFGDSGSYLSSSRNPLQPDIWHPTGYPFFLWFVSATHSLATVALLQHVMGLVAAWLVYRLVRSLGVGSVGGTVAAAPLLFDAYQLDVEQYVLSDTLFTLLVVMALVASARLQRRPTTAMAVSTGLLLAGATLTRTVGLMVAAVVLVVLLVSRTGWRRVAVAGMAFAVPVTAYALAFDATYGAFALQGYSGRYLYGIVGQFASCDAARLPVDQRALCPTLPKYARPGVNQYVWGDYATAHLPGGPIEQSRIAGQFGRRIATSQPGDVAAVVAQNMWHYFEPGRQVGPRDWYVGGWQFPLTDRSPAWNTYPATVGFHGDRVHGSIVGGLARTLRDYQRVVFTPGPAMLLAILAALAAFVVRRDRQLRCVLALLATSGVAVLLLPSVTAGFDWRYLLPAQAVLLPAGVIGITALRDSLRGAVRRMLPFAVTAVAVATVAVDIPTSSVYAEASLHPDAAVPVPATASIGGHLDVSVGAPVLVGTRCWQSGELKHRLVALVAFHTTVRHRSGPAALVQPGNVALSNGFLTSPGTPTEGAVLPSVLVSRRYPQVHGTIYGYVTSPAGRFRYVDPFGGGAAAWTFHVSTGLHQPVLGTPCSGATPWAGVQLPFLHIRDVVPFTQSAQQPVTFGLSRQAWRADSYDLRFRAGSATGGWQPWQYPKTWQRTTLTRQTLLDLTAGVTYCFSVRARDTLGAVSAWSKPSCTTRVYDDAAFPPSTGWTTDTAQPGFYDETYTATRAQNATLAVAGTFSRAALVLYRCPACGSVDVYVGTKLVRSINLAVPAARAGLVQWLSPLTTSTSTTLSLRVTSRDKLVLIDAFGLQR